MGYIYNLNLKSNRALPSDLVVLRYSFFCSSVILFHFCALDLLAKLYLNRWKTNRMADMAIKAKLTQLPTWNRGASEASVELKKVVS
jgi:hypothetical protein